MLHTTRNGVIRYIVTEEQIQELVALEQLKRSGASAAVVTAAVEAFLITLPVLNRSRAA